MLSSPMVSSWEAQPPQWELLCDFAKTRVNFPYLPSLKLQCPARRLCQFPHWIAQGYGKITTGTLVNHKQASALQILLSFLKPLSTSPSKSHPTPQFRITPFWKIVVSLSLCPVRTNCQRSRTPPLLTSSFRPSELLKRDADSWESAKTGRKGADKWDFIPLKVPDGISLRNFGIQV
ncbi:hypothetical protein BDN71DRAFT_1437331, partial [Pleurotus eryngii]